MVSRNQGALWTKLDDKLVLLDIEQARYFEANALGGFIWELLDEPRTVSDIVEHVVSAYRVDHEQCMHDVLKFLGDLSTAGLIAMEKSTPELESLAKYQPK